LAILPGFFYAIYGVDGSPDPSGQAHTTKIFSELFV
jgi:hypothetical protein